MGTRARVGVQLSDGSVLSAYHHWDGYPQWLGEKLKAHFATYEQAAELVDGGDMSCCWTKDRWGTEEKAKENGPQYYSERGDRDATPELSNTLNELFTQLGEEYTYVHNGTEWLCYDMHQFDDNAPELVNLYA